MFKKLLRLALAVSMTIVLVAATGQATNQMLSEQDLVDNVNASNLKWSGSAIAGSTKMVTYSEFTTYISNNGSCGGSSNQLMPYSAMTACRVLASAHSVTIASGNSTDNWACTTDQVTLTTSCSQTTPPNTVTVATLSSSTNAPTNSSSPVSISLTGLTYSAGCGGAPSLTVALYNSAGTNVYSGNATASTFSYSYYAAGASAGTYTWKVTENDTATAGKAGSCAAFDGGADGSYSAAVHWTGTSASSYY